MDPTYAGLSRDGARQSSSGILFVKRQAKPVKNIIGPSEALVCVSCNDHFREGLH